MKVIESIFISAGMLEQKKVHQVNHSYLNYGLLNLATILSRKHHVRLFQGDYYSTPNQLFSILEQKKLINDTVTIFLSMISYLSVEWAKLFINLVKNKNTKIQIIIGGRWVLSDKSWALKEFNKVNLIIYGEAENIILDINQICN